MEVEARPTPLIDICLWAKSGCTLRSGMWFSCEESIKLNEIVGKRGGYNAVNLSPVTSSCTGADFAYTNSVVKPMVQSRPHDEVQCNESSVEP